MEMEDWTYALAIALSAVVWVTIFVDYRKKLMRVMPAVDQVSHRKQEFSNKISEAENSAQEIAMSIDGIFWLMQITIVATAAIWWIKVIRSPAPAAATALLATMVAMGALGALLTFAHRAYFAPHWLTTQSWGLSPMEDQQIAGIIMWAPASLVYLIAALSILYRSLGSRAPA